MTREECQCGKCQITNEDANWVMVFSYFASWLSKDPLAEKIRTEAKWDVLEDVINDLKKKYNIEKVSAK
jgi:hypothetical protein